jgi:hypothetical protein
MHFATPIVSEFLFTMHGYAIYMPLIATSTNLYIQIYDGIKFSITSVNLHDPLHTVITYPIMLKQ